MNKVFITCGSGFIGTNFIYHCIGKGYTIMNYDKLTYAGNKFNLEGLKNNKNYKFIKGDICDYNLLYDCIINFITIITYFGIIYSLITREYWNF